MADYDDRAPLVLCWLKAAYLAGFNASGQGWNGEYPFQDLGENPEADRDWAEKRDDELTRIISTGSATPEADASSSRRPDDQPSAPAPDRSDGQAR